MAGLGRTARWLAAGLLLACLANPSTRLQVLLVREGYRLCEALGLMHPGGELGGQIMGHNYQRKPAWVHPILWGGASGAAFAPVILACLTIATPGALGPGPTLCGSCGAVMRRCTEPRCPRCGTGF